MILVVSRDSAALHRRPKVQRPLGAMDFLYDYLPSYGHRNFSLIAWKIPSLFVHLQSIQLHV
jgi:hypothetical protein